MYFGVKMYSLNYLVQMQHQSDFLSLQESSLESVNMGTGVYLDAPSTPVKKTTKQTKTNKKTTQNPHINHVLLLFKKNILEKSEAVFRAAGRPA